MADSSFPQNWLIGSCFSNQVPRLRSDAGHAEDQVLTKFDVGLNPTCSKGTQEVAAGEDQHVSFDCLNAADDTIRSDPDFRTRLASGTPVAEKLPLRILRVNFSGTPALELTIVPFHQVGIDLRPVGESRQFTSATRASKRPRQDDLEADSLKPALQH